MQDLNKNSKHPSSSINENNWIAVVLLVCQTIVLYFFKLLSGNRNFRYYLKREPSVLCLIKHDNECFE